VEGNLHPTAGPRASPTWIPSATPVADCHVRGLAKPQILDQRSIALTKLKVGGSRSLKAKTTLCMTLVRWKTMEIGPLLQAQLLLKPILFHIAETFFLPASLEATELDTFFALEIVDWDITGTGSSTRPLCILPRMDRHLCTE
jgi:hypothetical protein